MAMYCTSSTSPILAKQMVPCTVGLKVGFPLYQATAVPCVNMRIHQLEFNHS